MLHKHVYEKSHLGIKRSSYLIHPQSFPSYESLTLHSSIDLVLCKVFPCCYTLSA